MKKLFFKGCLFCLALLISSVLSYADVEDKIPKTINVQGKLTTDSGQPITDPTTTVTLYIYSDSNGSAIVDSKTNPDVSVDSDGLYNTFFDFTDSGIDFNNKYYFKVVAGGVTPDKPTEFASTPTAFYASTATYALVLSPSGVKLVNDNFDSSYQYKINVDSASYADNAIAVSTNTASGKKGYVWGVVDDSGTQQWTNDIDVNVSTANYAKKDYIGQIIADTYIKGLSVSGSTMTITRGSGDENTKVYLPKATNGGLGLVQIGDGLDVSDAGLISVKSGIAVATATWAQKDYADQIIADTYIKGLSVSGSTMTITRGSGDENTKVYLPKATNGGLGLVQIGDGLAVNDAGLISVKSGITVSSAAYAEKDWAGHIITDYYEPTGNKKTVINESSTDVDFPSSLAVYNLVNDTYTALNTAIADKQDILTFDTVPTENSNNVVYSSSIYSALQGKQGTLTFDTVPTENSNNVVYSSSIYSALQGKQGTLTIGDYDNSYDIKVSSAGWADTAGVANSAKTIDADLAEIYKSTEDLQPGDVVSIDTTKDDSIVKTRTAEDTLVAGVISTEPGLLLNSAEKGYKLALVGKVPTKVCNEGGEIKRGDLLVSASIAGYAKKAGDNPKAGTVIGKALENFSSKRGTILVLVNLQ